MSPSTWIDIPIHDRLTLSFEPGGNLLLVDPEAEWPFDLTREQAEALASALTRALEYPLDPTPRRTAP